MSHRPMIPFWQFVITDTHAFKKLTGRIRQVLDICVRFSPPISGSEKKDASYNSWHLGRILLLLNIFTFFLRSQPSLQQYFRLIFFHNFVKILWELNKKSNTVDTVICILLRYHCHYCFIFFTGTRMRWIGYVATILWWSGVVRSLSSLNRGHSQ